MFMLMLWGFSFNDCEKVFLIFEIVIVICDELATVTVKNFHGKKKKKEQSMNVIVICDDKRLLNAG